MAAKRKTLWLLAVLLVLCASSAFASIPKPDISLQPGYEEKLELFTDETPAEIAWPVIDVATFEWLDEVSHVEIDLPNDEPLIGGVELFAADEQPSLFAVKEKLASGVLGSGAENNVSSISELVGKMGWGEDIQALPFSEPATGLVYARARWYDPATGSFLTPDPLGYRDSSNLYSFAGGDPVNRRDPTGTIVQFEGSQPEQRLGYKDVIGWVDNAEAKQYLKFNGATRRIDVVGITEDEFISRFEGTAAGLLGKMIKAPKVLRIWAVTADTPKKATFDSLNGTENVRWRLKKAGGGWFTGTSDGYIVLYDRDRLPAPTMMSDNRTPNVAQTPETLIAHEVGGHAYDKMIGITFDTGVITVGSDPFFGVPPGEAAGLYSENLYRKAHGLPPRKKYKVLAGDWDPPEDIKQWFRDLAAGNERPTPGYPNVFEKP
jgi:RHS repeat-associated protein